MRSYLKELRQSSPETIQKAVNLAALFLRIENHWGLVGGGGAINTERANLILEIGLAKGITPKVNLDGLV